MTVWFTTKKGTEEWGQRLNWSAILSVNETSKVDNQITIFPNPAKDFFLINYDLKEYQTALFILYNSFNQEVESKNIFADPQAQLISTAHLQNGIYFWQIKTKDQIFQMVN